MADDANRFHIIVYQFGKVASTAVVSSFARLPGVTAVQSHFLGEHHLKRMVDNLTNPRIGSYFQNHATGQFFENVATTRDLNAFRQGLRAPEKLVVISAARDPFDWNRSRFSQDLEGFLPILREYADEHGIGAAGNEELIRKVLPRMFADFNRTILEVDGIDSIFKDGEIRADAKKIITANLKGAGTRRFFLGILTPFGWFDGHFCRTMDVKLGQFRSEQPGLLWHELGWADACIYSYEQAREAVPAIARKLGLANFRFETENVSSDKRHWDDIREAFDSPPAQRLAKRFKRTRYAQRFGYGVTAGE